MMPAGEPVAVDAHFDVTGEIIPRRFVWHSSTLMIEGIGRRWREKNERCFAVLAAGGRTFELRMDQDTFRWRVTRLGASGPVA
ncbi:MAG: hypothetical protein GY832_15570 [Chloroflexi bacterium]|nr:hypothetical protein [Chloroflexota bacterium]